MLRTLLAAALALAAVPASAQGLPPVPGPVHVADAPSGLNVRAGPGTAFPRIGVLARGEGGPVAGCGPTGRWCVLRAASGLEGWVYMPLTRPAAIPASLIVGPPADWRRVYRADLPYIHAGAGRVNLRQGAGTHRRIVGKLASGQGGYVQGCSADARWCLLSIPPHGAEGWVYMPLLRPAGR